MTKHDLKRLSRLTALLTLLQARQTISAQALAERFGVSLRTIYRDIRALEHSGVPVYTADGGGYAIMDGYRLPPVMFTENEALALITVEQLVLKNKDGSLINAYAGAMEKIRAVLKNTTKEKTEMLSRHLVVKPQLKNHTPSRRLMEVQQALTDYRVLDMEYQSESKQEITRRKVEPFAIYINPLDNWMLIAYCRLRHEFRLFRLDRIRQLQQTAEHFPPHRITLEEYIEQERKKHVGTDIRLSHD